jgi:hypothetical protein
MHKKLALCVGINYPGTSAELSGCVNDATDWQELLGTQGYEPSIILDNDATKDAILLELERLVAELGYGDRLVFTYSGHGTWVPDENGDEPDLRDEAVCAVDLWEGGLIIDDELDAIFKNRTFGSHILMLSDTCHSGSVTRFADVTAETPVHGTPKFIPPSLISAAPKDMTEPLQVRRIKPPSAAALISGCGDAEYSYDTSFQGRANGAFTRVAIDCYDPGINLGDWFDVIRCSLPSITYPQSPQLTTTSYRKYDYAL